MKHLNKYTYDKDQINKIAKEKTMYGIELMLNLHKTCKVYKINTNVNYIITVFNFNPQQTNLKF